MRHIVFVGFEQALLLDIAGPFEVFAAARKLCVARGLPDPYRLSLISPRGGEITTSAGVALKTIPLAALEGKPIDTLVVVGGFGSRQAGHEATLIGWIAERARHARRVCSVCTGAFLLAEAGLGLLPPAGRRRCRPNIPCAHGGPARRSSRSASPHGLPGANRTRPRRRGCRSAFPRARRAESSSARRRPRW